MFFRGTENLLDFPVNAKEDNLKPMQKPGITKNKEDGIYDIVVDAPKLTSAVLKKSLNQLSQITKIKYTITFSNKSYD